MVTGLFFGFVSTITEPKTREELGERLFFDPILSADSSLSCASCHNPKFAFADTVAISPGVGGAKGRRNAPSVMNMASRSEFFYDGRAASLRDQVHFPIEDPAEMAVSYDKVITKLQLHPKYNAWFMDLYGQWPDRKNVADAIASYEESLETADTEFDAWMQDRPNKMTDAAVRGREIFMSERAKCFDCHFSPDFTGDEFRNIGLYDEIRYRDKGRYEVTGRKEDLGKFKVPGLRNVAVTAPYMHDGSFKTLDEVIEYYSDPYSKVPHPVNMDSLLLKPIHFTAEEKSDLRAFLESLTDRRFLNSRP
jgi:cytochrome c peroxidase